ncbi:TetR/AcrR family transcriptional regulator [Amycolatopsis sp. WGS_07]|uniref:TetR/AcrR family transcriptional regulator n=1 Tax=Amycolatopsis sp. WGS_07 TaxID=3076764 RepID=UPI0038734255
MTAEATGDRRTRQRHERRDRLFQAAVELFVERGYDNTTMEDIAERADTARATVFNHFQRKTAFLDEWSLRRRERAMTAVRAEHLEDRPLRDMLSRYLIELARNSIDSRAETVACMGAAIHSTNVFGNPELARQFAAFVTRAQEAGKSGRTSIRLRLGCYWPRRISERSARGSRARRRRLISRSIYCTCWR